MFPTKSRILRFAMGAMAVTALGCSAEDGAQGGRSNLSAAQCDAFDVNGTVTICHATGSARNPIVVLRVSEAGCVNGHAGHAGDRIAVNGDCGPNACLPVAAPCDSTLRCCDGLTCNAGTCTDVDECATGNGGCSANASCLNNAGAPPTCTCNLGFTGDGVTCTASSSSCATASGFCYADTPDDDVAGEALRIYFTSLGTVSPTDFIYFDITTRGVGATGGAWCSERADWYVNSYLTHTAPGAPPHYEPSPGGHRRYSRVEGQAWSAPETNSYYNYFGAYCDGSPFSWCSEWGIGGFYLGTMPAQTQYWGESYVGNGTYWSYGQGWSVTIRVASTRAAACGF